MHFATKKFWKLYRNLPTNIKDSSKKNFKLLKSNPSHPSLHFKKIGSVWSVRASISCRAISIKENDLFYWFWIGNHNEYERIING